MSEKQQQAAQKKARQAEVKQVNGINELVTNGEQELQTLADAGNVVAREWMAKVQEMPPYQKLVIFGELKVALMQDNRPEAKDVQREMFPE